MAFKEVTAQNPKWDFAEEKELTGRLVSKETNVGPNNSYLYTIKREDGSFVSVWGSTVLDKRFALIEQNSLVKLIYKGRVNNEKSGRSYHDFSVLVDDSDDSEESVD